MSEHEHNASDIYMGPCAGHLPDTIVSLENRLTKAFARIEALEAELRRHDHGANGSYRGPSSPRPWWNADPIDCGLLSEDGQPERDTGTITGEG